MKTDFYNGATHSDPTKQVIHAPLGLVGVEAQESSAYILGDSITTKAMAVYTETACCGPVGVGRENTFVFVPSNLLVLPYV